MVDAQTANGGGGGGELQSHKMGVLEDYFTVFRQKGLLAVADPRFAVADPRRSVWDQGAKRKPGVQTKCVCVSSY